MAKKAGKTRSGGGGSSKPKKTNSGKRRGVRVRVTPGNDSAPF